jgi:pyruvate/2-oxoglutarate dehydrogenase complex dihydrolipoamide dehydrogenase (E3) component
LRGEASLTAAGKVTYKSRDGKEEIVEADHILIATGAASRDMSGLPTKGKSVINSHDAMILESAAQETPCYWCRCNRGRVRLFLRCQNRVLRF